MLIEKKEQLMSDSKGATTDYNPSTQDLVEEGELAADYIEQLLDILDLDGDLDLDVKDGRAIVSLTGTEDSNRLIGRYGKTLNAIQHLTRLAVQEKTGNRSKLLFDIDSWRERQRERLISYALRCADRVKITGEETELRPMSSYERKIIHDALGDIEGISTSSVGEEPDRRIVISLA